MILKADTDKILSPKKITLLCRWSYTKKLYMISRMVLVCLFRCLLQWGEKIAIAGKSLITQLNLKATVMIGDCIKSETHIQNTEKNQSQNYYFVC